VWRLPEQPELKLLAKHLHAFSACWLHRTSPTTLLLLACWVLLLGHMLCCSLSMMLSIETGASFL
jgi:hypothetical protein